MSSKPPPSFSLPFAQAALKDLNGIGSLLGMLDQMSPEALDDMGPLVFDVVKLENENHGAMALKRMIELRPKWVNEKNQAGDTVLMEAVWLCKLDLVNLLLDAGAQTNAVNISGQDVLAIAAALSETDSVQEMIGNSLLEKGGFGQAQKDSALYWAGASGHLGMTRCLLAHGAGFQPDAKNGTALAAACRRNEGAGPSVAIVSAMLATEAGMAVIDHGWHHSNEFCPIHCAAHNGNIGVLSVLIAAGARVVAPPQWADSKLDTPLMSAASGQHPEAIRLLLSAGCDAAAIDQEGCNAVHHLASADFNAREPQKEIRCLELLVNAGADPFLKDAEGRSPMDMARQVDRDALAIALAALASSSDLSACTHHASFSAPTGPRF